jgi:hypothetical protein
VIGFCDDANLQPGLPPVGPGKWRFLHSLNDDEIEIEEITIEHSDGVDSTPV